MNCYTPWDVIGFTTPDCRAVLAITRYAYHLTPLGYARYFALTFLLEFPFYWLACRSWKRALVVCFIGNLLTHPFLFLVAVRWASSSGVAYGDFLFRAEVFALTAEMLLVGVWLRSWRAALWVGTANVFSWTAGSLL